MMKVNGEEWSQQDVACIIRALSDSIDMHAEALKHKGDIDPEELHVRNCSDLRMILERMIIDATLTPYNQGIDDAGRRRVESEKPPPLADPPEVPLPAMGLARAQAQTELIQMVFALTQMQSTAFAIPPPECGRATASLNLWSRGYFDGVRIAIKTMEGSLPEPAGAGEYRPGPPLPDGIPGEPCTCTVESVAIHGTVGARSICPKHGVRHAKTT